MTVGPVCPVADLVEHPYRLDRRAIVRAEDTAMCSLPMHTVIPRLTSTPGGFRRPAPELGEHTDEILSGSGQRTGAAARPEAGTD